MGLRWPRQSEQNKHARASLFLRLGKKKWPTVEGEPWACMHSSWTDTSQGGENAAEGGVLARRVSRSLERRSMRLVPFTRCKVRRVLLNKPRASNRYSYGPSFLVINPGPGQHGQLPFSAAIAGRNALAMPQYLVACPSLRHGCGAESSR
jgi:hypothetical protein